MKKLFYKWIFFKMMGWKIVGTINPEIKKCVMMVDTDPERNNITIELVKVYNAVQDRLDQIVQTKTCDNINQLNKLYV